MVLATVEAMKMPPLRNGSTYSPAIVCIRVFRVCDMYLCVRARATHTSWGVVWSTYPTPYRSVNQTHVDPGPLNLHLQPTLRTPTPRGKRLFRACRNLQSKTDQWGRA